MQDNSTISTEGLGQPVEIGQIDGELKKLWEADDASTNASLMNFLIYTEDPHQLTHNSETAQNLTQEHACRAVLIGMNRSAEEPSVDAWITAHCHLAHGKKSICSEQISFLLQGKAVGRLRNTVFAHLNSDLPLVFWWQGDFSDLFDEKLYRPLDRLIFDSADWCDPERGFGIIAKARDDNRCHLVTQDLAWTRGYYFRLAIAGVFDDPLAQQAFATIFKVHLTAKQSHRTSALQIVAWIAEMAKWTHLEGFTYQSQGGQEVTVEIDWTEEGHALAELTLFGENFTGAVTRVCDSKHLCQKVEAGDHKLERIVPADLEIASDLIAEQLSRGGKNSLFLRVLPGFLKLLK